MQAAQYVGFVHERLVSCQENETQSIANNIDRLIVSAVKLLTSTSKRV